MSWLTLTTYPDPRTRDMWGRFLAEAEYPTHYTSPAYFTDPFVRGGERFAILSLDPAGTINAVMTGIDSGKTIFSGLATRPQLTFRKDADKDEAVENLILGLHEKGGSALELARLYTWNETAAFRPHGFCSRQDSEPSLVMLDLSAGADEIFKGFSQTRRNELRKTLKSGALEIGELDADRELDQLYALHKDWNARKGNRADTFEDLRLAVNQPENRRVFVARRRGRLVAASYFRFCRGGVVEYAANNSMTEYQKFRPNDLLVWHAIQWACEENLRLFSMGGSHLFLRRFGGQLWHTSCYTIDRTFLRRYQNGERLHSIAAGFYEALPVATRARIKKILSSSAG